MSSKKCSHCSLVNFAKAENCKRCSQPLGGLAKTASQRKRPNNNSGVGAKSRRAQKYEFSCVLCGTKDDLSMREIEHDFVPTAAALGHAFGLRTLASAATITHQGVVPFCDSCRGKHEMTGAFQVIGFVGAGITMFLGFVTLIYLDSISVLSIPAVLAVLGGFALAALVIALLGIKYSWSYSIKVKKVDRTQLIVETFNGENIIID